MQLKVAFWLALLVVMGPLLLGVGGLISPLTVHAFEKNWQVLWQAPAIWQSIGLTLWIGFASTLLSLWGCFAILRHYAHTPRWQQMERRLSPLLAFPHVAMAMGLVLLLSPSGWLYRIFAHLGFQTGNFWSPVQDQFGLGLIGVLFLKETPFLLLMSAALLPQLNTTKQLQTAQQLGYPITQAWWKLLFPAWLPQMRLPIYAVLGYNLSVVDLALIIGPTRPAPFAVRIWEWLSVPNLNYPNLAIIGAWILLCLILLVFLFWWGTESLFLIHCRQWRFNGADSHHKQTSPITSWLWLWLTPLMIAPLLSIWSFSLRWPYPNWFPKTWTVRFWQQQTDNLFELLQQSLWLALASTLIALICTVLILEYRHRYQWGLPLWIVALPLVIPPLSLMLGVQTYLYQMGSPHYALWVLWGHVFFVFPYVYLTLNGPWQSYDKKWDQAAMGLGKTPWRTFWQVRYPQLLSAIWLSAGVGISVSLAQYLPTQMLGAGRITTLTTQAVALASGQDRRITAIYALLQGILPLVFFVITLFFSQRKRLYDS